MMLTEQADVPVEALPLAALREHLRFGTGFADDGLQDPVLESSLRAALAAVEARTGKAVLRRGFLWSLAAWRDLGRQVLPIAPVEAITGFAIVDADGSSVTVPADAYRLDRDFHRPSVVARGLTLPTIPVGGRAELSFEAGFGTAWPEVPADLAQAALRLAGHYYEHRHDGGGTEFPADVAGLVSRYRNLRVFGRLG